MAWFAGAPSSYLGAEAEERQRRSGYALLGVVFALPGPAINVIGKIPPRIKPKNGIDFTPFDCIVNIPLFAITIILKCFENYHNLFTESAS